jgi:hypothetical protein
MAVHRTNKNIPSFFNFLSEIVDAWHESWHLDHVVGPDYPSGLKHLSCHTLVSWVLVLISAFELSFKID